MTDNYVNLDQPEIYGKHRSQIITGIQNYVKDHYDAEVSQINLNSWQTRFDVDIETPEEIETLIETVNDLLRDSPVENAYLYWEAIPTKYSNDTSYDGYHNIGKWGHNWEQFADSQYPVRAFKVEVVIQR